MQWLKRLTICQHQLAVWNKMRTTGKYIPAFIQNTCYESIVETTVLVSLAFYGILNKGNQ